MSLLSLNLQTFLAIVENKTVHGAARELGLTQTAVTQRIRSLESSLSTTLFTRSRKGMALTLEGQALLRYCQGTKELEGVALAHITGGGKQAPIQVGITGPSSIMRSRIVPQCLVVLKNWPELSTVFEINDLGTREEALRSGRAHLAVLERERVAREMDSKLLKPERYVLVGSRNWKRRELGEILQREKIIDFDPTDTLTFSYLRKFKLIEKVRPERHFVNNTEALVEMFAEGLGYGVLTEEFAAPFLKQDKITLLNSGFVYENLLALAWYPRSQMPAYFKAIVNAIC